jgi:hypothetical protein
VKPEVVFVELCAFRTCLEAIEKIQLRIVPGSRKQQSARFVSLGFPWPLLITFLVSWKRFERCGGEFLIVNGVPVTQEQYARRADA